MKHTHDYGVTHKRSTLRSLVNTLTATTLCTALCGVAAAEATGGRAAHDFTTQVIVKYNDRVQTAKTDRARDLSNRTGLSLRHKRVTANGADVFTLDNWRKNRDVASAIARLAQDPNIEYAEPDLLLQAQLTPNDSRYNEQWHYFEPIGGLNLPQAWDNVSGAGVVVAVLDTGYRPHADLADNILPGYDFISDPVSGNDGDGRDADAQDPGDWINAGECGGFPIDIPSSWHGTHVAGTIAAVTDNAIGVAGTAFNAKILPVRVLGKCGGSISDVTDAIIWASGGRVRGLPKNTTPAHVINLSLGGEGECGNTFQAAIDAARANGSTVVVAAGNASRDAINDSPANCEGVITVAATDRSGGLAWYSNFGDAVEVSAPGGDVSVTPANGVLSTLNSGTTVPVEDSYNFYQGTSMATPHIAGLAALLYEAAPGIDPDDVAELITATARPFPVPCDDCGAGIADAAAAVTAALSAPSGDNFVVNGISGGPQTWNVFTVEIPDGMATLTVSTSGGRGNSDLYVKFGADPALTDFNCNSSARGTTDSCTITNPAAGTWHLGLYGERRSYRNVDLEALWTP